MSKFIKAKAADFRAWVGVRENIALAVLNMYENNIPLRLLYSKFNNSCDIEVKIRKRIFPKIISDEIDKIQNQDPFRKRCEQQGW